MIFDANNKIVKLCAEGLLLEGNDPAGAKRLYNTAWEAAESATEKCIAAHYLARHQSSIHEKLKWDLRALDLALGCAGAGALEMLPSLYLNVGKGYEDLRQAHDALHFYQLGLQHSPDPCTTGYAAFTRRAIEAGLARVEQLIF